MDVLAAVERPCTPYAEPCERSEGLLAMDTDPVDPASRMRRLPNRFLWWDPRVKQGLPGPTCAYSRFCTHAPTEAQRLGLGLEVLRPAQSTPATLQR